MTFSPSAATLVGDELLSFVKKNGGMTKTQLAEATGYTSTTKDGKTRCNFAAMQEALIAATGITFGRGGSAKVGVGGRKLSFVATVQGNGNLLIGKAYTQKWGYKTGDEFKIELRGKTIRLVPQGEPEAESTESADVD